MDFSKIKSLLIKGKKVKDLSINGKKVWAVGSEELPQLSTPIIELSGDTLSITDTSGLATSFDILVDGVVKSSAVKQEVIYLAAPYTVSSYNSYGDYFYTDVFGDLTTSSGYGAHSIFYLTISNVSINLNNYGKLYCLTENTTPAIEVPQDTEIYILKGSQYTMSSPPYSVGDSRVMKVGKYDNANNNLIFTTTSGLVNSRYSSGKPSAISYGNDLYALIDGVYRLVYILVEYQSITERTKLSSTAIGSFSRSITSDGTIYKYSHSSLSYYESKNSSSIQTGNIACVKRSVCKLELNSTDFGSRYVYATPEGSTMSEVYKFVEVS